MLLSSVLETLNSPLSYKSSFGQGAMLLRSVAVVKEGL
jgi:hypothetical protein